MSNRDVYRDRLYQNDGFSMLVDMVSPEHHRILDVGCGNGANLRLLKERGHTATGLTLSETEARIVEEQGLACRVWDITSETLPFPPESFDALIFSHVLEHVAWPEVVLRRYCQLLKPTGKVVVAVPNAMQFIQRWKFLLGRFRYTETGIMDRTHLHFFDFLTARQLLESAGLEVERHFGLGQFPVGPFREWLPGFSSKVDRWVSNRYPGLFAFHLIIVGRLPAVE